MSAPPVSLALGDPALARRVAQWLEDEGLPYRTVEPGRPVDPSSGGRAWLTDAATLRAGAVDAEGAIVVLGDADAWEDRALAADLGAVRFVALPPARDAVLDAVHAALARGEAPPVSVCLVGPADEDMAHRAAALAGSGARVTVESDPRRLFGRPDDGRPDLMLLLPGLAHATLPRLLRMIRLDRTWDDTLLLCVVPPSGPLPDLPPGTCTLAEPRGPQALAHAVLDVARRRRAPDASAAPAFPVAMQALERRALDAHALVSIADGLGNIVYANDHFCRTSGYRRDELLGRNHRIVRSGAHPPEVFAQLWRTIAGGAIWQGELCNRRKDGSLYWVATTIVPTGETHAGTRRYLSIRTDITAAKRVQIVLRRRVRQQRLLVAISRRLLGCDRERLIHFASHALRLGGRLLGAARAQWVVPSAAPDGVADWRAAARADGRPAAAARPDFSTPASAEPDGAGQVHWWLAPGGPAIDASDRAFAEALAGALGSAWQRTGAELARRASQHALTDMLRAFPGVAAAVGDDGVYEFANEAYARLYGLASDQIVGRSVAEVLGPAGQTEAHQRREMILRADRPLTLEHSLAVPGEAEPRDFSIVHFTTGGSGNLPRRFFQIGVDVTERRRMEDQLKQLIERTQSEARLQKLIATIATELGAVSGPTLDHTLDRVLGEVGDFFAVDRAGLFLVGADGSTFGNTHEWCAAGVPSKKALLQDVAVDALPWYRRKLIDERVPVHVPDVEALPAEASAERGKLRELGLQSALAVPFQAEGRVLGAIGFDSIRQRVRWPETAIHSLGILGQVIANALHRVRTEKTLVAVKEQAETASAAKSDFLASMSHELRTPMNAVLGFGQLLELALERQPQEKAYVQEILKGGRHLLTLIDDVLDLARIESGRVDLSPEPIALADSVGDCMRLMQPLANRRGIRIAVSVGDAVLRADRVRLKQVLVNLVSNAIKYNVDGGRVDIGARAAAAGRVRVEVRDTGPGIAPGRQRELFQPFSRLGAEVGPIEGTGIGLMLVRRLVGLMGGEVGVDRAPGHGSVFWFELPEPEAGDGGLAPTIDQSVFGTLQAVHDKRVLYVDDNPPNLRLMESILSRWPGVTLLTAQQPQLGLELAEAHRPDLVLLDIQMAPLDGYQVLRRLRRLPGLATVPVVAITASAMPRDLARARAAGFDHCLTKPVDLRALLVVLEKHLRQATATGPGAPPGA